MEYLNPEAFFPQQAQGGMGPALSGIMDIQKIKDYNELMRRHYDRSDIDIQEKRYDWERKQKEGPVKDIELEIRKATAQGKLPYAGDVASSEARAQIEGNEYKVLQHGPEGRAQLRQEWRDKLTESQRVQMEREAKAMLELVDGYKAYGPEWAQQRLEQYQKLGYQIDPRILDPDRQEAIRKGLIENIAYVRNREQEEFQSRLRMKEQAAKDAEAYRRAQLAAETSRTNNAATNARRGAPKETLGKSPAQVESIAIQRMAGMDADSEEYAQWSEIYDAAVVARIRDEAIKEPYSALGKAYGNYDKDPKAKQYVDEQVARALRNKPKGKGANNKPAKEGSNYKEKYGLE